MPAAVGVVEFEHQEAVQAYLGKPNAEGVYPPGIQIEFDDEGRIKEMQSTLTA